MVSFQDHPILVYQKNIIHYITFFIWILAKFILEKCIFDFNIHTFFFMIYKCAITGTLELNAIENVVIVYKPITAITSTEVA